MSRRVVVLDPQRAPIGRDWPAILPAQSVTVVHAASDIPSLERGDLLIVHGQDRLERAPHLASEAAARGYYVIVVSGSGFSPREFAPGVYYRRTSVATHAEGPDRSLGSCVERFLARIEGCGEADFGLLEPSAWPERVVALRAWSIGLAGPAAAGLRERWRQWSADQRRALVAGALFEFQRLGGRMEEWTRAGLPAPNQEPGPDTLDALASEDCRQLLAQAVRLPAT